MTKALIKSWMTLALTGALVLGCSKFSRIEPAPPPVAKAQIGEFGSLPPRSFLKATLPLVLDRENAEVADCLAPSASLEPVAPVDVQMGVLEKNEALFESSVKAWLTELLAESGVTPEIIQAWGVAPTDYQVLSVHPSHIDFAPEPSCLDNDKRQLDATLSIVSTLYGAQKFMVTAPVEFDLAVQQKMLEAFDKMAVVVEPAAYHYFQPALEPGGEPKKNFDGENLYTSKTGELIPESQVPAGGERPLKEWTIAFDEPFFFAGAEFLPESRGEAEEGICDVYLIWDDPSPQKGECEEYSESGFAVVYAADTLEISLTVTTEDETTTAALKYDETAVVRANERTVIWVTPKEIEEGVLLAVDSYVLRPFIEEPVAKKKKVSKKRNRNNKKKKRNGKKGGSKRSAKNAK